MATAPHRAPGVTLIGRLDWPQNLYIAQALHDAGWQTSILTEGEQPKELAGWLTVHHVNAGDERMLSERILQRERNPDTRWILPLDEASLLSCHRTLDHSDKLFPRVPAPALAMLQRKSAMASFAANLGMAVPQWEHVQDRPQALGAAQERLGYPVVLKGEQGDGGSQVRICKDAQALQDGLSALKGKDTLLQRHVAGRNWACGGFFHQGALTHLHCYEIVQQHPADLGAAARVRHEHPPALVQALQTMGAALQWTGYMQADFIRDSDGTFWFLEINPRPWGSITAAVAAGVPIFAPLLDALAGREPQACPPCADGWEGHVFPKPLLQLASQRRGLAMLKVLLSPGYWRTAPPTSFKLLRYFFKVMYWYWRGPQQRERGALATKTLGCLPRV